MFDEIMRVKLVGSVFKNDAGKEFSTGMWNRKTL